MVVVFPNPTGPRDVVSGRTLPGAMTHETVGTLTCWQNRDGEWWGAVTYSHPTCFTPNSAVSSGTYLGVVPCNSAPLAGQR